MIFKVPSNPSGSMKTASKILSCEVVVIWQRSIFFHRIYFSLQDVACNNIPALEVCRVLSWRSLPIHFGFRQQAGSFSQSQDADQTGTASSNRSPLCHEQLLWILNQFTKPPCTLWQNQLWTWLFILLPEVRKRSKITQQRSHEGLSECSRTAVLIV